MNAVFWSSVGAAIGGFIGVICFFLIRLWIEYRCNAPSHVQTYLCGNDLNQGQTDEAEGELMHHHGKRIDAPNELSRIDLTHPAWEWTRTPVGRGSGATTIYGPYSTDFPEPGLYSTTFRIKGTGFAPPRDIRNNVILLELDVNRTIPQYNLNNGGIAIIGAQYKIARRYVRVSELAIGGWINFELKFYSDGQGIWEYRINAYDGLDGKLDNIGRFGSEVRILFDTISIMKLNKLTLPWV